MKRRLTRIAPLQAAKIITVVYLVFSLPFVLIALLAMLAGGLVGPMQGMGLDMGTAGALGLGMVMRVVAVLVATLVYGIVMFALSALACVVYNIVAARFGGLELELQEVA